MEERGLPNTRELCRLLYRIHNGHSGVEEAGPEFRTGDGEAIKRRLARRIKQEDSSRKSIDIPNNNNNDNEDTSWILRACPRDEDGTGDFAVDDLSRIDTLRKIFGENRVSFERKSVGRGSGLGYAGRITESNEEVIKELPCCWGKLLSEHYGNIGATPFVPRVALPTFVKPSVPKVDDPSYAGVSFLPEETFEEFKVRLDTMPSSPTFPEFDWTVLEKTGPSMDKPGLRDTLFVMTERRNDVIRGNNEALDFLWGMMINQFDATEREMGQLKACFEGVYESATRWNSWGEIFGTEGAVISELVMGFLDKASDIMDDVAKRKFGEAPESNPTIPSPNSDIYVLAANYSEALSASMTEDTVKQYYLSQYESHKTRGEDSRREYLESMRTFDYKETADGYAELIARYAKYNLENKKMIPEEFVWITDLYEMVVDHLDSSIDWEKVIRTSSPSEVFLAVGQQNGTRRKTADSKFDGEWTALRATFWKIFALLVFVGVVLTEYMGITSIASASASAFSGGNDVMDAVNPQTIDPVDASQFGENLLRAYNTAVRIQDETDVVLLDQDPATGFYFPEWISTNKTLGDRVSASSATVMALSEQWDKESKRLEDEEREMRTVLLKFEPAAKRYTEFTNALSLHKEAEAPELQRELLRKAMGQYQQALVDTSVFSDLDAKMVQQADNILAHHMNQPTRMHQLSSSTRSITDADTDFQNQLSKTAMSNPIKAIDLMEKGLAGASSELGFSISSEDLGKKIPEIETIISKSLDDDVNVAPGWRDNALVVDMVRVMASRVMEKMEISSEVFVHITAEAGALAIWQEYGKNLRELLNGVLSAQEVSLNRFVEDTRMLKDLRDKLISADLERVDAMKKENSLNDMFNVDPTRPTAFQNSTLDNIWNYRNTQAQCVNTEYVKRLTNDFWSNPVTVLIKSNSLGGEIASSLLAQMSGWDVVRSLWALVKNVVLAFQAGFPNISDSDAWRKWLGSIILWGSFTFIVERNNFYLSGLAKLGKVGEGTFKDWGRIRKKNVDKIMGEGTLWQNFKEMVTLRDLRGKTDLMKNSGALALLLMGDGVASGTKFVTMELFHRLNRGARNIGNVFGFLGVALDSVFLLNNLAYVGGSALTEAPLMAQIVLAGGSIGIAVVGIVSYLIPAQAPIVIVKSEEEARKVRQEIASNNSVQLFAGIVSWFKGRPLWAWQNLTADLLNIKKFKDPVEGKPPRPGKPGKPRKPRKEPDLSARALVFSLGSPLAVTLLQSYLLTYIPYLGETQPGGIRFAPATPWDRIKDGITNEKKLGAIEVVTNQIRRETFFYNMWGRMGTNCIARLNETDIQEVIRKYPHKQFENFVGYWADFLAQTPGVDSPLRESANKMREMLSDGAIPALTSQGFIGTP